jgi:hypothetical protein
MAEAGRSPSEETAMSESAQADGVTNPFIQPWMEFWSRTIEQSQEQTSAVLEAMQGAPDLETLRRRWLDSLSKNIDMFMRSPAFLEAMRRNFEAMTEMKSHSEEAAQNLARETGIPRISDVSGLFERLRLAQEVILDRLSAIERRLEAIETAVKRSPAKRNG